MITRPWRTAALACAAALFLGVTAGCSSDTPSTSTPSAAKPDLNRPPANVHWDSWRNMKLPRGDDGPRKTGTSAPNDYTRTPQGAALAAIQATIRLSIASDTDWPMVAKVLLVDGPGKNAWVTNRVQISMKSIDTETLPHVTGYKLTAWTQDRADVTIYTQFSADNSRAANHVVMTWTLGDWRLLLPDPATPGPAPISVIDQMPPDAVHLEAPQL